MHFLPAVVAQTSVSPAVGTGFLPFARGSFMLDFVFTAMFLIMLVQGYSIHLVRNQRKYELHKKVQLVSALVLLLSIVAFEVDLQFVTKWEALAEQSYFWNYRGLNVVWIVLAVHLCFAIPTPFIWAFVIFEGLRKFPNPAGPNAHSHRHRRWGWIAAISLLMTSITGWAFYVFAFVL